MLERPYATMSPALFFPPSRNSVTCNLNVGSKECGIARTDVRIPPLSKDIADEFPQTNSPLIETFCRHCPVAAQATVKAWGKVAA